MFKAVTVMLASFTLLLGVVYPVVITLIAQLVFPYQANGSLMVGENKKIYGSMLIGQEFKGDQYFWGRLSATASTQYNVLASGGSNLGYGSKKLHELMQQRALAIGGKNIPIDLVTASGSGLDPHISVESAVFQIERVAKARNMDKAQVMKLVELSANDKQFGVFGEPNVNVLKLNLLLDKKITKH